MDLTDQQWTIIEALFEEKRRPVGRARPWRDARAFARQDRPTEGFIDASFTAAKKGALSRRCGNILCRRSRLEGRMNEADRHCALAYRRRAAFDRSAPNVSGGEHARKTRLEEKRRPPLRAPKVAAHRIERYGASGQDETLLVIANLSRCDGSCPRLLEFPVQRCGPDAQFFRRLGAVAS
jgi:hypothetical protein